VLKVNAHEHGIQASMEKKLYDNRCVESFFKYCVVTSGRLGAMLIECEKAKTDQYMHVIHKENFPTEEVPVKDVTGCGDTHTAALTFSYLKTRDVRRSVKFANACARDVVQKFGTSVTTAPPVL
jgi:sugar/nucleoside kinase (ribokinase family)